MKDVLLCDTFFSPRALFFFCICSALSVFCVIYGTELFRKVEKLFVVFVFLFRYCCRWFFFLCLHKTATVVQSGAGPAKHLSTRDSVISHRNGERVMIASEQARDESPTHVFHLNFRPK